MAKSPAITAAKAAASLSNPPAVSPKPSSPAGGSDATKSSLGITDDTSGLLGVAVEYERRPGRGAISNASGPDEPTARIAFDGRWWIGALLVFGIVRNLHGFEWLAPGGLL